MFDIDLSSLLGTVQLVADLKIKLKDKCFMKKLFLLCVVVFAVSCRPTPTPTPTPSTSGTMDSAASTSNLPNRLNDGPLPGCVDAFELVSQTLSLPPLQVTLDAEGIIDRVGVVTSGASYKFSVRPVRPITCKSSNLPPSKIFEVTFGFNYLGDYSRNDPLCINGSSIEFTNFEVSGMPFDKLIEKVARNMVWQQVDFEIAKIMHPLLIGGTYPVGANPRCGNWIDLSTL